MGLKHHAAPQFCWGFEGVEGGCARRSLQRRFVCGLNTLDIGLGAKMCTGPVVSLWLVAVLLSCAAVRTGNGPGDEFLDTIRANFIAHNVTRHERLHVEVSMSGGARGQTGAAGGGDCEPLAQAMNAPKKIRTLALKRRCLSLAKAKGVNRHVPRQVLNLASWIVLTVVASVVVRRPVMCATQVHHEDGR